MALVASQMRLSRGPRRMDGWSPKWLRGHHRARASKILEYAPKKRKQKDEGHCGPLSDRGVGWDLVLGVGSGGGPFAQEKASPMAWRNAPRGSATAKPGGTGGRTTWRRCRSVPIPPQKAGKSGGQGTSLHRCHPMGLGARPSPCPWGEQRGHEDATNLCPARPCRPLPCPAAADSDSSKAFHRAATESKPQF